MDFTSLNNDAPTTYSNLTYDMLYETFYEFEYPVVSIFMGGTEVNSTQKDTVINDVKVELSAGYEASIATFRLYNVFDSEEGDFRFDDLKTQVLLGNAIEILMGYAGAIETVFVGFASSVAFGYEARNLPYIEVTAMDIKGLMMGGSYAASCKAEYYSAAVEEIFQRTGYQKLKESGGVVGYQVDQTPDAPSGSGEKKETDYTIELVSESDYEFVVRAGKKFNFDFFVDRGMTIFRKAKSDTTTLATLNIGQGLVTFHIEYSLTGVVGEVEARAMDVGTGKLISSTDSFPASGKAISSGGKAKALVGSGKKVYIDSTINSTTQAEARAEALKEKMSYRLGHIEGECVGMPVIVPGRFIKISGMGVPVDNDFYLTQVTHQYTSDRGYVTTIEGCTNSVST